MAIVLLEPLDARRLLSVSVGPGSSRPLIDAVRTAGATIKVDQDGHRDDDKKDDDHKKDKKKGSSGGHGAGDAIFDGDVGYADLLMMAKNYNSAGSSWVSGDYDYSGSVNFADLLTLAKNYNYSAGSLTLSSSAAFAADFSLANSLIEYDSAMVKDGTLLVTTGVHGPSKLTVERRGRYINVITDKGTRTRLGHVLASSVKAISITGYGFDDVIHAEAAGKPVTVHAGGGADEIFTGSSDDVIYGDAGDDQIHAGGGSDQIYGGTGDDRLWGDAGDDRVEGGGGKDRLDGGKGRNRLSGGGGTDYVSVRAKDTITREKKDKLVELA